jgi:DMSO/TMAO reductase YedYZ heme-binding membrane subunit
MQVRLDLAVGIRHGFSWLKAGTSRSCSPAIWLIYQVGTEQFGPVPLGGMTYWSGLWATAILMLALAVTPALTIFRWRQLIIVRRMIGVTALAYTIAHIIIYFALRLWDFGFIAREMVSRLSLIVATVSTIGLIALGATSLDAAIRRMGAEGWNLLHNTVYVITALALLHYLLSPGIFSEQFLMSGMSSGSWSEGTVSPRAGPMRGAGDARRGIMLFHGVLRSRLGLGVPWLQAIRNSPQQFHPRPRPRPGVADTRAGTSDRWCSVRTASSPPQGGRR